MGFFFWVRGRVWLVFGLFEEKFVVDLGDFEGGFFFWLRLFVSEGKFS